MILLLRVAVRPSTVATMRSIQSLSVHETHNRVLNAWGRRDASTAP